MTFIFNMFRASVSSRHNIIPWASDSSQSALERNSFPDHSGAIAKQHSYRSSVGLRELFARRCVPVISVQTAAWAAFKPCLLPWTLKPLTTSYSFSLWKSLNCLLLFQIEHHGSHHCFHRRWLPALDSHKESSRRTRAALRNNFYHTVSRETSRHDES